MDIAILCTTALVATVFSGVYLSNRKPSLPKPDEIEDENQQETQMVTTFPEKAEVKWKTPTVKQWLFLILMFLGLCAMSVTLELIYDKNSLLDNLKLIALLSLLFVAANIDAKERIIPNVLVVSGLVLRVGIWVAELIVEPDTFLEVVKDNLVACLLVVIFVVVGVLIVKGGLGMGDIKLMLVMCLFQGFYGVVSALFFGLFVAFIYAIIVLIAKKKTRRDSVPFAPAILIGTMISVFLTGM